MRPGKNERVSSLGDLTERGRSPNGVCQTGRPPVPAVFGSAGEFRIRYYLTDALRAGAGHIGYSIKKEYRSRGYGTKGLALTLDVSRKIVPEDEIYLRVLKTNIPSFTVIRNNGGYVADEDEEHYLLRVKK